MLTGGTQEGLKRSLRETQPHTPSQAQTPLQEGQRWHLLIFPILLENGPTDYRMLVAMVMLLQLLLLSRFSHVRLCVTPQTSAHQALLSLGFSRLEHWSGLPFPSPRHESEK